MGRPGQKEKNNQTLGVIARAALLERGHIRQSLDPWAHEGPAPRIPSEDAADLRLYFSEERRTEAEGGVGSNFDAIADRMHLYSRRPTPCMHCGGVREVKQGGVVVVEATPGSGLEVNSKRFLEWLRIEKICQRPHGPNEIKAWLEKHNPAKDPDGKALGHGDYFCQRCDSWGWIFRGLGKKKDVTVGITGQIPKFVPRAMDGGTDEMERLGRVGRKRSKVRSFDPISDALLEAIFSPDGKSEEALWHLTPTGNELLKDNRLKVPHLAFFRLLRIAKDQQMRRRFERVRREAAQLETRMHRAWCKVAVDA